MKGLLKRLITSILVVALVFGNVWIYPSGYNQVQAASTDNVSAKYLNATIKYLHLGKKNSFNFDIKKAAKKDSATYTWFVDTKKGKPDCVSINKKTGEVTAKKAGTSYIYCKITESNGRVIKPEAKVIVRNNITKVDIGNLPDSNSVKAYQYLDFTESILNTEGGKGALTEGVTYFELAEDTAGVSSVSADGIVFPTKEGEFKVRAIAFQSADKYKLWLKDKKANASAITASSKWYTIKVLPSDGNAEVTTQKQLEQVLAVTSVTNITATTEKSTKFILAKGDYSKKTFTVNAPNGDVENHAIFQNIYIKAIKDSTWIEYADGNIIYLSDSTLHIVIDSNADIKEIVFDTPNTIANIEIMGNVGHIRFIEPAQVILSGSSDNIPVTIENQAVGTTITSSVPINLSMNADANIVLKQGAEESSLDKTSTAVDVKFNNQTEKTIEITTNHENPEMYEAGVNTIPGDTPTVEQTATPTVKPTTAPVIIPPVIITPTTPTIPTTPTATPTLKPTATPTVKPTASPEPIATAAPTAKPTAPPEPIATATPTLKPTAVPTAKPTAAPTAKPTTTPTTKPTASPEPTATVTPTTKPTASPEPTATATPTTKPTASPEPTATVTPTTKPTASPEPTATVTPTTKPTASPEPTAAATPTASPEPTATPTPDTSAPAISSDEGASISSEYKTITITFNETIKNNLESLSELKENIELTTDDGATTIELAVLDNVVIQDNQLVITLDKVMMYENVKVIISGDSIKDIAGNIISNHILTNALIKSNNTMETASELIVNTGMNMYLIDSIQDVDWISFDAIEGQSICIKTTKMSEMLPFALSLYNSSNELLIDSFNAIDLGKGTNIIYMNYFIAPATGTYYLKALLGPSPETLAFGVDVMDVTFNAGEPNNTHENATKLQVGAQPQKMDIYPYDDIDWFSFDAVAGEAYNIQTLNLSPGMDTYMLLFANNGTMLNMNNDGNFSTDNMNSRLLVKATENTTYYIVVLTYQNLDGEVSENDIGLYDIVVTPAAEAYVAEAEVAVSHFESGQAIYHIAMNIVTDMPDSDTKTALLTRLDAVKLILDHNILVEFNNGETVDEYVSLFYLFGNEDYSVISQTNKLELADLFMSKYPTRNFVTFNEAEQAFITSYNLYNSLINNVNNATDVTTMQIALNEIKQFYHNDASELVALSALYDKGMYGLFETLADIFDTKTSYPVTFSAMVNGGAGEMPMNNVITATVDGVAIHSGDYVEVGKKVVFTVVPGTGYAVIYWWVTGSYEGNVSGTQGGDYCFPDNKVTFQQLHTSADVKVALMETDTLPPTLTNATISNDYKIITLSFDESIDIVQNNLESLKSNIIYTSDEGVSVNFLTPSDNVQILDNNLIIYLDQAVNRENLKVVILANSLKDVEGNMISNDIMTNTLIGTNNTKETATSIVVDADSTTAWMDAVTDVDWYRFDAAEGDKLRYTIATGGSAYEVYLYNDSDDLLISNTASFGTADSQYLLNYFEPTADGTYYLKVIYSSSNTSDLLSPQSYTIKVEKVPLLYEGEPNNSYEAATILNPNSSPHTNYIYQEGDKDWFKFEGKVGVTYFINTFNLDITMDSVMKLYCADGSTLLFGTDSGPLNQAGSSIIFSPSEDGSYYIRVGHVNESGTYAVGKYNIEINTMGNAVETYVAAAEAAVATDPQNAQDEYDAAQMYVGTMTASTTKTALQQRLDLVNAALENVVAIDVNNTNDKNVLMQRFYLLNCNEFNNAYNKQRDEIVNLFILKYPVRNFTTKSEVVTALSNTTSIYLSTVNLVNSAADVAAVKSVLEAIAESYGIAITDQLAQAVYYRSHYLQPYNFISDILITPTTYQVTFSPTLLEEGTDSPVVGEISATVDGVTVNNGDFIDAGKEVVFTATLAAGYSVYKWHVTGNYNNSGIISDTVGGNVESTNIKFKNLHTNADVSATIVKTSSADIPNKAKIYSLSSGTDLSFTVNMTNTTIKSVCKAPTYNDILSEGYCTIGDNSVTINKEYLSSLGKGDYNFIFDFTNSYIQQHINLSITD